MTGGAHFSDLNPQQREAVLHTEGPLLVLAGAGSGKTRVITNRMVHLLERGVPPHAILAVSFTNKAADEMRERMARLVSPGMARGLFLSTFHSLGLHILKQEKAALGWPQGFAIYDTGDQLGVLREILREAHIADRRLDVKALLVRISRLKNAGVSPDVFLKQVEISRNVSEYDGFAAEVYPRYQQKMKSFCALDFDDLLVETERLLRTSESIRKRWQRRFQYILVDEYQDTNLCQLALLQHLGAVHRNVMVVGDDDQSIYSWRGASSENILSFDAHFPGARTIKLEQNYRSCQPILDVANHVIEHNGNRRGKRLWSQQKNGSKVQLVACPTEEDEATFVANEIQTLCAQQQTSLRDIAVLYRSNVQARVFEEVLRQERIPFRMIGGQAFYDRKEIKDAIAYVRCLLSPRDEISLRRILNYPARGIGPATLAHIEKVQQEGQPSMSLWDALLQVADQDGAKRSARLNGAQATLAGVVAAKEATQVQLQGVAAFANLIQTNRDKLACSTDILSDLQAFFSEIGMEDEFIRSEPTAVAAQRKIRNLSQLLESLAQRSEHFHLPPLEAMGQYIHKLTLQTQEDSAAESTEDLLTLSTLHGAKGLEFHVVFLVGLEEELLPHKRTLYPSEIDAGDIIGSTDLSEERRLFYVGITRARKRLFLTRAAQRGTRGVPRTPSRFLSEIPSALLEERSFDRGPTLSPDEEEQFVQRQIEQLRNMLSH